MTQPQSEFVFKVAEIEVLLAEYKQDIAAAAAWYEGWKERNSGFRCRRRRGRNDAA